MTFVKTRTYKCSACGEIYVLDVAEDQRALYPEIVCDKCESLCQLYRESDKIIGNIEDVENNNLEI